MRAQYLDRMDIERERGITIKAQNVRMPWTSGETGVEHVLHMIDTPGHVDFTYEVSRSLAACEGAVLLVDAAQGIEAQTLANLYLALENDLQIIPVLNKIDLPAAQPDLYAAEIAHIIGCEPDDVLRVSAKTGEGVAALLDVICRDVPAPVGEADAAAAGDDLRLRLRHLPRRHHLHPRRRRPLHPARADQDDVDRRDARAARDRRHLARSRCRPTGCRVGEVGYLITGVKDVRQSPGRRHRHRRRQAGRARASAATATRGRWSTPGCIRSTARTTRCCATPSTGCGSTTPRWSTSRSPARRSGFGFRCGFLGLLHLEITRDRLEREFDLDLISTAPNVVYRVLLEDGAEHIVTNPSDWPTGKKIAETHEPVVKAMIIAPSEYIGAIMELCQERRGNLGGMDYLSETRVELRYTLPLGEIIFDFFDQLKSRTRGYASLDYELAGEQAADLVKVDILLQGEPVDAFSAIVHKDKAYGVRHVDDRQAAQADPAPAVRGADPGGHRRRG